MDLKKPEQKEVEKEVIHVLDCENDLHLRARILQHRCYGDSSYDDNGEIGTEAHEIIAHVQEEIDEILKIQSIPRLAALREHLLLSAGPRTFPITKEATNWKYSDEL